MKKKFIEPEMKRIKLNLNENIASSEDQSEIIMGGVRVLIEAGTDCLKSVQDTGIHFDNYLDSLSNLEAVWLKGCFVDSRAEVARRLGLTITNDLY